MSALSRLKRLRGGEFGGLANDTLYVGVWQFSTTVADLAQIALIAHVLGLGEYGRLAVLMSLVALVGQFFDVRVTTATAVFATRRLVADPRGAGGVFQLSYAVDALTGVVGFLVVLAVAPFVGERLVGEGGTELVVLYALTLLIATTKATSITVLRLTDRYPLLGGAMLVLEASRVALVAAAILEWGSLRAVVLALIVYELLAATTVLAAAVWSYGQAVPGGALYRPATADARAELRPFLRMTMHTNVMSYSRLAATQLPTLVLGAVTTTLEVGLYKIGMAAAAVIARLSDPAFVALLPRLSRLWAEGRRGEIRRLFRQASIVSVPATVVALVLVIVLRDEILRLVGGEAARAAGAVVVLGAAGHAVNGALFWNARLPFAADRAAVATKVFLAAAAVQVALLPVLIPRFEAVGAAAAFLIAQLALNVMLTWVTLSLLRDDRPAARPSPVARRG